MDYIRTEADGQLTLTQSTESTEYLILPSCLYGFHNNETTIETAKSKRVIYCHRGILDPPEEERVCTCGQRMHINSHPDIYIRHLCIGGNLSGLLFPHNQLRCPKCGATKSQFISFKAEGHLTLQMRFISIPVTCLPEELIQTSRWQRSPDLAKTQSRRLIKNVSKASIRPITARSP